VFQSLTPTKGKKDKKLILIDINKNNKNNNNNHHHQKQMSTWPSHQQQQQQQALKPIISPLSPNQQQQPQSPSNILLTSKLLRHITIDQPYELDKQWTAFLKSVDELVSNCTETEAVNKLHERLGDVKNKHAHSEICLGLMFGILIAPDMNKVQFVCLFILSLFSLNPIH
jgi:hypothetical protein